MALRMLKLDPICLSHPQENILLHVESEAEVLLASRKLETLSTTQCLEVLSSGEVWVCRGRSCRIECVVTLNGVDVLASNFDSLVESIFKVVGNSEMWDQLGLSAVLHLEDSSKKEKVVLIALRHSQLLHTSSSNRQPWSVNYDEVLIPDAVPRVEFQRLQIRFDFQTGVTDEKISKILTNSSKSSQNNETPNQSDYDVHQHSDCGSSESVNIKANQDLTGLLMHCTERLTTAVNSFIPILLSISPTKLPTPSPVTSLNSAKPPPGKLLKRQPLPKEALDTLMTWVEHHPHSQRPQLQDREELAQRTGLEPKQIRIWFDNRARRHKRQKRKLASLSDGSYDNETCQYSITECGNESLLEVDSEALANSISKNRTASTSLAQSCIPQLSFQDIVEQSTFFQLKPIVSHSLVRKAMQLLIGNRQTRQIMPQGVQIHKPPTTSLATLCPVMFSPGFKKSMAHNARYLPRITHSFTHFARYAQSPSLREKLDHLTSLGASEFVDHDTATKISAKSGSETKLAAVIQSRLWTMMHRNVYSPSAARRAMNTSSSAIALNEEDCYHDLLDYADRSDEPKHPASEDDFRWMISDEERDESSDFDCLLSNGVDECSEDEFDDLLGDGEEDKTLSDSEREKFDTESEMDKIWFGRSWQVEGQEEDSELILADGDGHYEMMLLGDDCTTPSRSSFTSDDMLL